MEKSKEYDAVVAGMDGLAVSRNADEAPALGGRAALKARYPDTEILYTIEDLMAIFQMGRSTIYKMMISEKWPHSKYGVQRRFEEADVEAIKAMHRREPVAKRAPRIGTRARRTPLRDR